jgi:NAD(P)-dependent dehydrogenase (short-subunit alcohol dehydrogenase family)
VTGVFLSAKAAAIQMIRTKSEGSIILIASMSATIANRDLDCVAYNASKAGVLQMGRNLACEWGKYKIRVNVFHIVIANSDNLTRVYRDHYGKGPL